MMMRPLLASTIPPTKLHTLRFPVVCSPKIDGIRCLIHPDLGPVTRKLKPIPNNFVRNNLTDPRLHYLDGEIVVGDLTAEDAFNATTRGVMSADGFPPFKFWVFDHFKFPELTYKERLTQILGRKRASVMRPRHQYVRILEHCVVENVEELLEVEREYLDRGFEGVMLRSLTGHYKFNRSTLKEQILVKLKRFIDEEGRVVGFKELFKNLNELEEDELGYAKRSSAKGGKVAMGMLGKLIVQSPKYTETFGVGTGFSRLQRMDLWGERKTLIGRSVKFRHQEVGAKDRPRFPAFIGFRED